jgi:uncharacterized glyoxalase superfamily metalloenzyme YdcJ
MYAGEVGAYARLFELVLDVNRQVLGEQDDARADDAAELARLSAPRHGAIRIGRPDELALLVRLFAQFGMQPVDFYDLVPAGLPVMSTAFRPVVTEDLEASPFRMFCSLLRPELIADRATRTAAVAQLDGRQILSTELVELLERAERAGGVREGDAEAFVACSVDVFRWRGRACTDRAAYDAFCSAHKLIADIAAFPGPHINHLTPSALDIDRVQAAMVGQGFNAKELIEGPPRRACPILLRQTACKAEAEVVAFPDAAGGSIEGRHAARFGEVEQRGVALTPRGREHYDRCLAAAQEQPAYDAFADFPDTVAALVGEELAYFRFARSAGTTAAQLAAFDLDDARDRARALAAGVLTAQPIRYEDFLPVSAAGIFRSNLDGAKDETYTEASSREVFERHLGCTLVSSDALYARQQSDSLASVTGADPGT